MPRLPLDRFGARRIVLLKPSALGDIMHTLPTVEAIRVRFPDAFFAWVVNRAYVPLVDGHPAIDRVIPFDRAKLTIQGFLGFCKHLRQQRFDLAIDLQGLLRTGIMTAATGAARKIGLSTAREGAGNFYTDTVLIPEPQARHAVDWSWSVAEALGVGDLPKKFRVCVQPAAQAWVAEQVAALPRPRLVVSPGSRWLTKRWPTYAFAELVIRALRESGGSVQLIGTPDEVELSRDVAQRVRAVLPNAVIVDRSGQTSMAQLPALLQAADVVIANDTGPLHVAAALGRPTVAPYTCTRIQRHGPFGGRGAVETTVPCRGSYVRTCSHLTCMSDLKPDHLWPHLREILAPWLRHSRSA